MSDELILQLRTRAEACRKANLHKDAYLHDKSADALTQWHSLFKDRVSG